MVLQYLWMALSMIPRASFPIGTYDVQPRSVRRERLRTLRQVRRWLEIEIEITNKISDLDDALGHDGWKGVWFV